MHSSVITPQLVEQLKTIVGSGGWLVDREATAPYAHDWHNLFHGRTPVVLLPSDTEQVSKIVHVCAEAGIAIVPQGGNTGYMGGATPNESNDQIVVSLARMNRIRELDADNYTLTAEAGCILSQVQDTARVAGLLFPLSLGAEGSCHIGGNLSTNAGGTAVLRYGNTRDLTLGLEVVLPDGRIWHGLRRLRKNNTGYDFRHLFIGAEGTLGIITAAVLRLFPRPENTATAMVALPTLAQAVALLSHMRKFTGDLVTGFEYIHGSALNMVATYIPNCRVPLTQYDQTVLIELAGGAPGDDLNSLLESALEAAFNSGLVDDAVIANSLAQHQAFWHVRENIPEALARAGKCIPCDVSVPVSSVPAFIAAASEAVNTQCPGIRIVPFGHVGDGNIHFDLLEPVGMGADEFVAGLDAITRSVYDVVAEFNGSFSAEHGIGQLKIDDMRRYREPVDLDLLRAVKHAFDPRGLMNPGKLVPGHDNMSTK